MQKNNFVLILNILLVCVLQTNTQEICGTQDETCYITNCCDGYECYGLFTKLCKQLDVETTSSPKFGIVTTTDKPPDRKKDEKTESSKVSTTTNKPNPEVKHTTIKFVTEEYLINNYPESVNEHTTESSNKPFKDNKKIGNIQSAETVEKIEKDQKLHLHRNHTSNNAFKLNTFNYLLYLPIFTSIMSLI